MTGPFAMRLFRISFAVAGCYNLAFGLWAGFWPLEFFRVFGIVEPIYPQIWACLGMVVGVYGLLYLHVAWKPETGKPIIAVGLLGKVLGPIGMVMTVSDTWPSRLAMLNVYNDVIWFLPFGLFLIRDTRLARSLVPLAPWLCAVLHLAAMLAMPIVLQPGLLTQPEPLGRATYLVEHQTAWTAGWLLWMTSAMSLVAFYAWWGGRLKTWLWPTVAVFTAGLGMVCDLSGETLSITLLVERAEATVADPSSATTAALEQLERIITLLTAGAANGLYTLGGIILTLSTPGLPRGARLAMWITWLAGAGMTIAGAANFVPGMVLSTAILFPVFILWTVWMAWRWRPEGE